MLADLLSAAPPANLAIVTTAGRVTWSQLRQSVAQLVAQFAPLSQQRVGVLLPANAAGLAALCALDQLSAHAYLLDESLSLETVYDYADRFAWQAIVTHAGDAGWQIRPLATGGTDPVTAAAVTILTSGTEGAPKAATYTWETLARPVRSGQPADRDVWLLSFRIHLYAGLQVVLQALVNGQTLVATHQQMSPDEIASLMAAAGVTCASATPSYWRRLVLLADAATLATVPLRQITLGGELADQAILDALSSRYPAARIVHIYATTELGRCFAVTDGKAGFPRSYLHDSPGARPARVDAQLKVEDGQLFVQPVHGVICANQPIEPEARQGQDWLATGDLVQLQGDRVLFAGRAGDMINVGGNKVRPAIVENVLRSHPGVSDVRVYGKASSIAGQLVACEIVAGTGHDPDQLRIAIGAICRAQLQSHERPRLIEFVNQIQLTSAGKVARREEA